MDKQSCRFTNKLNDDDFFFWGKTYKNNNKKIIKRKQYNLSFVILSFIVVINKIFFRKINKIKQKQKRKRKT